MPVLSFGHSQYWQGPHGAGTPNDVPIVSYPLWQTSVICGSGFGVLQVVWTVVVNKVKADGDAR